MCTFCILLSWYLKEFCTRLNLTWLTCIQVKHPQIYYALGYQFYKSGLRYIINNMTYTPDIQIMTHLVSTA